MKKLFAAVIALMLITVSATMAERIPFTEWLEQQAAVAEQPVAQDELLMAEGTPLAADTAAEAPSTETVSSEAAEEVLPEFAPIGMGSRGIYVEKLQEKLNQLGIPAGKVDGRFGPMTEAALKTVQNALGWEETGVVETEEEWKVVAALEAGDGVNLAVGTSDEWSEWMKPEYNQQNRSFYVAYAYPQEKKIGDVITCQVEIEFSDVAQSSNGEGAFAFYSQGAVDGAWEGNNIWNPSLVRLDAPPANKIYKYIASSAITEKNVNSVQFNLGFRCDYWASGSFRVRKVKVEKGFSATEWSAAPLDISDGINLAANASEEWSDWMTPDANAKNKTFYVSSVDLSDKVVGESFTSQFEIEFSDVTATTSDTEEVEFAFWTQGAVDGAWEAGNIWNSSMVRLSEAPADGVYKYTSTVRITDKNVNATHFDLGFRCDYWASGSFRVRNIKVERGTVATQWTPAQ